MISYDSDIKRAAEVIQNANAMVVCAGAGMGVDSGLPDFRGNQGFWKAYPPFARLGYSFTDMANPEWFERDPELAWGFYGHRLNLYRQTIPHKGFRFLLEWSKKMQGGYFVFTSNVDGQFQLAGYDDQRIVECHGSIHHLQCSSTRCHSHIWDATGISVSVDESTMKATPPLPSCPKCNRVTRPNILMFGDWGWIGDRTEDQSRRFNHWLSQQRNHSLVIVECGAGTGVPTVRMTSENLVSRLDGTLIRLNPREPQVPRGQIGLPLSSLEALERINKLLEQ